MSFRTTVALSALALALTAAPPARAAASCSDDGVCLSDAKAKWDPDASLSAKQLKAKRKGSPCKVAFEVEGGRGSVFINGRYAGTAPLSGVSLLPGKHDVQVRDGDRILAEGVLTVPKGGSLQVVVRG
jgi:hypothetical protein